jgi:catechol 2,3-dioxygenase-like lactoylglutathione lyase family enzyme
MRILAFDHLHVYAADPGATVAFYEDVLGAERLGSIPAAGGRRTQFVILGGQVLAITAFPVGYEPGPMPELGDGATRAGFGVAHLGLNVDDLEAWIARLEGAGVHVHSEPRGEGLLRYVYFTAPDGVIVELTQYDLPSRFRPAMKALEALNRSIHRTKAAVTGAILRRVPAG